MELSAYWAKEPSDLLRELESSSEGLSSAEALQRLRHYGRNELSETTQFSRAGVLWSQVRSPLLLLLVFAAFASLFSGEWMDAGITLTIVFASVAFGFAREYKAQTAIAALRTRLHTTTTVVRNGSVACIPPAELVPGDVILLSAGSLVPADGVVLEANHCYASEAVLTGESYPVEKRAGTVSSLAPISTRSNCVHMGTNVRSGTARCLIVNTGRATQHGAIARRLELRPPEPEFERGLRRFGYLLMIAMLVIVLAIFAVHMFGGKPPVETLLFAIALAVGLSPELLPAILSVNLSAGAQAMAKCGVLVRHLNAIEDLGSMDVLCTDKTGTLTEGVVRVEGAYDVSGLASQEVLRLAALNAALETGLSNPLDNAILAAHKPDLRDCEKLGEIPFDFIRKRLSVVVRDKSGVRLITKGAFVHVLEVCTTAPNGVPLDGELIAELQRRFEAWSNEGIRVVAVAQREIEPRATYSRGDEHHLTFTGFVTLLDRPKTGALEAIRDLAGLGVSVKLITGDHRLVAQHIARSVGMSAESVLTGEDIEKLPDGALWIAAERTELFVEVDPNQKERIILALKKMGHVVGFLGDGVNDAPAMHAADTSLSVEHAVDVARDAADFVLLEQNLDVIRLGIVAGRKTFANTLKYLLTTTSANLGNMLSMAFVSLYLPFLPLLASQILLNNFLSDIPAIGLAKDAVDPETVAKPRRWDLRFIARFMVAFGLMSSFFDLLTFGTLLVVFRTSVEAFRTGWFVESLLTELVIALIVRTRRPFFQSRPGRTLLWSTIALVGLAVVFPYLPFIHYLGFVPVSIPLLLSLIAITAVYVVATEVAKRPLLRWSDPGK